MWALFLPTVIGLWPRRLGVIKTSGLFVAIHLRGEKKNELPKDASQ